SSERRSFRNLRSCALPGITVSFRNQLLRDIISSFACSCGACISHWYRGNMAQQFRQEKDSIGIKEIPADVYYGVQTARAVENYPISGMRANPTLIRAIGMVKYAAAQANKELGLVDDKRADAIMRAAKEVVDGEWDASFVVDVFQAGAGVSFHMNSNEVVANRATELLGGKLGEYTVHPNDHVNYGQSTNDVFPTAMRLATLLELEKLDPVLDGLASALEAKG